MESEWATCVQPEINFQPKNFIQLKHLFSSITIVASLEFSRNYYYLRNLHKLLYFLMAQSMPRIPIIPLPQGQHLIALAMVVVVGRGGGHFVIKGPLGWDNCHC